MEIPEHSDLLETSITITWRDENGILCSVSKKAPAPDLAQSKLDIAAFKEKYGEEKYCFVADVSNAAPISKEAREWMTIELNKMIKAIAMVSKSAFGRMAGSLYLGLKPTPYPSKMFANAEDAKEWIKQYL